MKIFDDFGCMIDCRLFVDNNKENKVIFVSIYLYIKICLYECDVVLFKG